MFFFRGVFFLLFSFYENNKYKYRKCSSQTDELYELSLNNGVRVEEHVFGVRYMFALCATNPKQSWGQIPSIAARTCGTIVVVAVVAEHGVP